MEKSLRGSLVGAAAILSWGSLGALGTLSVGMPPYIVFALCFAIAALLGAAVCVVRGITPAPLWSAEILVAALLLGSYHMAYFEAFHHAPAIPVSLINYLWPACLIIIGNLFFALDSGWRGYLGAFIGFLGVVVLSGGGFSVARGDAFGFGLALAGAILWATYSNLRRRARFSGVGAMVSICILAAAFCFAIALLSGEYAFTPSPMNLAVILLLGVGPAGGAFFLWDYGMRHGNATLLGVMGYAAPVLSTLLMVLLGMGEPSWRLGLAVVLITLGGVVVQLPQRPRDGRTDS